MHKFVIIILIFKWTEIRRKFRNYFPNTQPLSQTFPVSSSSYHIPTELQVQKYPAYFTFCNKMLQLTSFEKSLIFMIPL